MTWQYSLTREGETEPVILTRQVLKKPDEQDTLRIETAIDGTILSTEFLKNQGKAILATAYRSALGETQTFDPPITILPGDLNFGAEWQYRGPIAGLDLTLPLRIVGEGEVEVPAGKFRALHFRGERTNGLNTVADFWFTSGVGSIKEMVTQRSPGGDLLSRNTIELLKPPFPSPAEPKAKKLEASVSTSSDGDPLHVISADALQIVARWRGHGLRKNARIRAVWIAVDTGVAPIDFKVDEATVVAPISSAFGKFTLSRPPDGWATGKYRVEFYVDHDLIETVDLTITPSSPTSSSEADFLIQKGRSTRLTAKHYSMNKNILALCLLFALAGCDIAGIRGNGHIVTQERKVDPFINIDTGGSFRIDWHSGPPSLSITVDENLMPYVETEVRNKVLHVRTTQTIRPRHSTKLTVTSNALEGASFSGASRLTAHQLSGTKFYLETTGASEATLDGTVDELVANLTGASDLRAESLQTKTAQVSVTGAGDARIAVSDTLKVSITGAGKVEYIGNPHIERDITGAGSIRKREK